MIRYWMDRTEDRFDELEEKSAENNPTKYRRNKKKGGGTTEQNIREVWDMVKKSTIHIIRELGY